MNVRRGCRIFAVILAAASCRSAPPGGTETDLLGLLVEAEVWRETGEIDFGSNRDPALLGGWTQPSRDEADYLWGFGDRSELELRRADARAFRIRLRGWAHPRLPEGQEVRASINGIAIGTARLGAAPGVVELEVPDGVARPGLNRLAFEHPVVVPTGRYGRPFGAALDGIRFDAIRASQDPEAGEQGWTLPAGTGIDLFPELLAGSELAIEGLASDDSARLAVDLECRGGAPHFDLPQRGSWGGSRTVALDPVGPDPAGCRLALRAGPVGERPPGVIRFAAARLRAPAGAGEMPVSASTPTVGASSVVPPSFVLYLVDALRADRLGVYGSPRPLTPAIDAFAGGATLFENARAQTSWTRPAVATLFTGLTPLRHGAVRTESRLPEEVRTLAERLRERGYRTAYVTSNGNTAASFGFDQGVDHFRWLHGDEAEEKVPWREVNAAALEFFDSMPAAAPFLLVVHTIEPHAPYEPTSPHRARWAADADPSLGERPVLVTLPGGPPTPETIRAVTQLYEAEVASADEGFAAFLAELERRRRRAGTSVLFLSDHGEELFDHGNVEHGRNLYEEQLRIPMIWSLPGESSPRRVRETFDQLDVLPTILELVGAPPDPELPGRSFAGALRGGPAPASRPSAAWLDRLNFREDAVAVSGFKLRRKLSRSFEEQLFDLTRDPAERAPIETGGELQTRILRARLRGWEARSGPPLAAEGAAIDDRLRDELRALGYIQ